MKRLEVNKKIILLVTTLLLLFLIPQSLAQYNYEYANTTARVNVTNSMPEIQSVLIDQDITLNAGGIKPIQCNASIQDWNGWDDIALVNATLYHTTSTHESPDDGNTHYTNTSCENTGNDGVYIAQYTCTFYLIHYANNGTWTCQVHTQDTYGFTDSMMNTTTINELYAINVTDMIDYGDLAVTDTSPEIPATLTNFGNMAIGVSVLGYGAVEGDGYGLMCALGGNIGVEHQRFSEETSLWIGKTPLASTNQDMSLTIPQATDLTAPTTWTTFWQLYVPPNPQGECTGTIRFTATPA